MSRARDNQKQKLYGAEAQAFGYDGVLSLDESIGLVRSIEGTQVWKDLFNLCDVLLPMNPVTVKDGRGCKHARASLRNHTIVLPRWSRLDWMVIHELAHLATNGLRMGGDRYDTWEDVRPWHGREFCGVYLELIREFKSPADYRRLKSRFFEYNVDYMVIESREGGGKVAVA